MFFYTRYFIASQVYNDVFMIEFRTFATYSFYKSQSWYSYPEKMQLTIIC